MANSGVNVSEVIDCGGKSAAVVSDVIVAALGGSEGYQFVAVSPQHFQAARSYRPTWATAVGAVSILLCGIGILLFFYKKTELCSITIEETHRGASIRINGQLTHSSLNAIKSRLQDPSISTAVARQGDPAETTPHINPQYQAMPASSHVVPAASNVIEHINVVEGGQPSGVIPGPTPDEQSRESVASPSPVTPDAASLSTNVVIPPPTGAVSSNVWAPTNQVNQPQLIFPTHDNPASVIPEETVARGFGSKGSSQQMSGADSQWIAKFELRFDTGAIIQVAGSTLIGRDPAPSSGEESFACVVVDDPDMSISKTHLSVVPVANGVLVTDRGSTNGSFVLSANGQARRIAPHASEHVGQGGAVQVGNRVFHLEAASAPLPY